MKDNHEPILKFPEEFTFMALAIWLYDFEAKIAAITDDVPLYVSAQDAIGDVHLFVLLDDVSLRALIPTEFKRALGFDRQAGFGAGPNRGYAR